MLNVSTTIFFIKLHQEQYLFNKQKIRKKIRRLQNREIRVIIKEKEL